MTHDITSRSTCGRKLQISVEVTIEVRLKHEVLRLEVFFASGHAHVDHVIHHHEPGKMRARSDGKGTFVAR